MDFIQAKIDEVPQRGNAKTISLTIPKASGMLGATDGGMAHALMSQHYVMAMQNQMMMNTLGFGNASLALSAHQHGLNGQTRQQLALPAPASGQLALPPPPPKTTQPAETASPPEIEVITTPPVVAKAAPLAIADSPAKVEKPREHAVAVSERLEQALGNRDNEKVKKPESIEKPEEKPNQKTKKGGEAMKRPASSASKCAKPPNAKAAAKKKAAPSPKAAAGKAVAKKSKTHSKGPITRKDRLKYKPDGCSSCRWVKGCLRQLLGEAWV